MSRFNISQTDVITDGDGGIEIANPEGTTSVTIGGRHFVFVTNEADSSVNAFELASDGSLTFLSETNLPITQRAATTINMDGTEYLLLSGNDMTMFAIGADGSLLQTDTQTAPIDGSFGSEGTAAMVIGGTGYAVIGNRFAQEVYIQALNNDGTFGAVTGTLGFADQDLDFNSKALGIEMIRVGDATIALAALDDGTIMSFTVNADGSAGPLTFTDSGIEDLFPRGFDTFSVDGASFVVIANDTMVVYRVNGDGTLSETDQAPASDFSITASDDAIGALEVFETADGRALAYVGNSVGDTALVEFDFLGDINVLAQFDGDNNSETDEWRGATAVQVGSSAYFVHVSQRSDEITVHEMTIGADFTILEDDENSSNIPDRFLQPGDDFEMFVPIVNIGDVGGDQVSVTFILSVDNEASPDDRVVGDSFSLVLGPGGEDFYTYSFDDGGLQIPANTEVGTYYIYAELDLANDVEESNELNNTSPLIKVEVGYFTEAKDTVTLIDDMGGPGTLHRAFAGNDVITIEASGVTVDGGSGKDTLTVAEGARNVVASGGKGNDLVTGASALDRLNGGGGSDVVKGKAGNDLIDAGGGKDTVDAGKGSDDIIGGGGADRLTGGKGDDWFIFNGKSESKAGNKTRDVITDFERGEDALDLSGLDGNADRPRDQNLTYLDKDGFTGSGGQGEVRWIKKGDDVRVAIDLDADGRVDMEIQLLDVARLSADDFIL